MTEVDLHFVLELLNQPFVLGEFTTDAGPYDDDHFIVIATFPDHLIELPAATERSECVLEYIRGRSGKDIELSLNNSTEFKSRILYPDVLAEAEFFSFVQSHDEHQMNFLRRLIPTEKKFIVSQVVKKYLQTVNAQT